MTMSDKVYNKVKWVVTVVLPACGVFLGTVGTAINWQYTDLALTLLTAVTTLLGATMLHSTAQYNKEDE